MKNGISAVRSVFTKRQPEEGGVQNKGDSPENRPTHEVRLGSVKASLWPNQTPLGVRYNVTVTRLYRDTDASWKTSQSFGRDDLLLVCKVLDMAHTWMLTQGAPARTESNGSANTGGEDDFF